MRIYLHISLALLLVMCAGVVDILYATTNYIFTLSIILALQIFYFNLNRNNEFFVDPLVIFSLVYFGYALGGIYYSFSDGSFGKFLEFTNLTRSEIEQSLFFAIIYVNICYLAVAIGYKIVLKRNYLFRVQASSIADKYLLTKNQYIIWLMIIFGFIYWIWISNTIADGVLDSLILFQLFPHLAEEHGISIAPYLIYFAAINIWLMSLLLKKCRLSYLFIFFSILGFVISISTARISISLTYAFAQMYLIYMVRPEARGFIHKLFVVSMLSGLVLYFLRDVSNHLFLNDNQGLDELNFNFFKTIIAGGNVADLQQLVIIFKTFSTDKLLFGLSYLDWFTNSISNILDIKPTSVGLRIANLYVPDSSGAPTPGAIGEAFANFHLIAPVFMFFFGIFLAHINNLVAKLNSIVIYFCYSCFLTSFVFLFPKVDSTMVTNFFWNFFPTLLVLIIFSISYSLTQKAVQNIQKETTIAIK